jgi:hypothetical protein
MKIHVFTNRMFVGEFSREKIFNDRNLISVGTVLNLDNKNYCVYNVALRKDGTLVLEVQ